MTRWRFALEAFSVLILRLQVIFMMPADCRLMDTSEREGVPTSSTFRHGACVLFARAVLAVNGEIDLRDVFMTGMY